MGLFRLWTWALLGGCFVYIVGIDVRPEIDRYCRDRDRLITSEELDEYLLVDAEINGTLLLECHFWSVENSNSKIKGRLNSNAPSSKEADDKRPRIWYFQDRYQTEAESEVELGMDNNMSYNRIHVTPEFSLVIREFDEADAGIYRCHGADGQEAENKYNYRLEAVHKESAESAVGRGNITDWESYKEINLEPVTTRFAVNIVSFLLFAVLPTDYEASTNTYSAFFRCRE